MARIAKVRRAIQGVVGRVAKRQRTKPEPPRAASRPARREPDIPLDVIEHTYTPTQTSLKTGFRSDGTDRQRDQEFAEGFSDERWGNEDHYTNRSGDPRIGTHRRKHQP